MLNTSFVKFKSQHLKKKNQMIYYSVKTDGEKEIENLINNFLIEKNSFIFESVEKGFIKGRYTIFGKNPDKIWEFNNNNCKLNYNNKTIILKGRPKKNIEKIIEDFKFFSICTYCDYIVFNIPNFIRIKTNYSISSSNSTFFD